MNLAMTFKGSNEPSAPVAGIVKNGGKVGRGERIRTSGPCLPNALPLVARRAFPLFLTDNSRHSVPFVPVAFTVEVQNEPSAPVYSA